MYPIETIVAVVSSLNLMFEEHRQENALKKKKNKANITIITIFHY